MPVRSVSYNGHSFWIQIYPQITVTRWMVRGDLLGQGILNCLLLECIKSWIHYLKGFTLRFITVSP